MHFCFRPQSCKVNRPPPSVLQSIAIESVLSWKTTLNTPENMILNSVGARTQPWLTPLLIWNEFEASPTTETLLACLRERSELWQYIEVQTSPLFSIVRLSLLCRKPLWGEHRWKTVPYSILETVIDLPGCKDQVGCFTSFSKATLAFRPAQDEREACWVGVWPIPCQLLII